MVFLLQWTMTDISMMMMMMMMMKIGLNLWALGRTCLRLLLNKEIINICDFWIDQVDWLKINIRQGANLNFRN